MSVSCRVCGIEDWLNCGCYYLHGGQGGLGDMNTDYKFIHCPECDNMGYHERHCGAFPIKCKCGTMLDTDGERIAHDCDYYPADPIERDELWNQSV